MSQPSSEDPAFRHPDTPKRAGDTDQWRRAPAATEPSARPAWSGSPALRDSGGQRAAAAAAPRTPHSSDSGALTPAHVNPFECDDMMTSLSLPTSSPSLFERVHSPNKEEPGLEIEHRAQLFPAQIDLTPYHKQLLALSYDPHKEVQVQTAIERFFNSDKIIPSPWSAGTERRAPLVTGYMESPLAAPGASPLVRDCGTQTQLTLPAQLPAELERALAPYLCGVAADRSASPQDDESMLSNSTLRRKLLFHHAGAGEPPSCDVSMAEPDTSAYHFPGTPDKGHLLPTSPLSPGRPRTSVSHRHDVESPPVSPICKSMMDSPSTSSIKSQGLAKIRYPSSDLSEPSDDESAGDVYCGRDHDSSSASCGGGAAAAAGGPASPAGAAADDSLPDADESAPQDTGYHSTLASLPSLSARHLAAAESSHLARLIGSGSASMLASTRLDEASVLAPPVEEEERARPPVPIGSSTPSRAQYR